MNTWQIIGVIMLYIGGCPIMTIICNKLISVLEEKITWIYGGKSLYVYICNKVPMWFVAITVLITWPISYIVLIIRAIVKWFIERKLYLKRLKEKEERKEFMKNLEKEWTSV